MSEVPTYGAFVLDPGGSSGLAWGRVRDEGSIAERLAAMNWRGSETVTGPDWLKQAEEISRRWATFRAECHLAGLPAYFVCEDFILTKFKSSDRSGLYPVWIAAAVMGYRTGLARAYEEGGFGRAAPIEMTWQSPSQAKTYATDERLRSWGLWIKGREHERDAWRHFAYFVAYKPSQQSRIAHMRVRGYEAKL